MDVRLVSDRVELEALRTAWTDLYCDDSPLPPGMDATSTFEWAEALQESFLGDVHWSAIVATDDRGIAGILPLYRTSTVNAHAAPGEICLLTELYGGRNGFLIRSGSAEILRCMFQFLQDGPIDWDVFRFTLVNGSRSFQALQPALGEDWHRLAAIAAEESPYVVLPEHFDSYIAGLDKNHRNEIRRRTKKFFELGRAEFVMYDAPTGVEALWSDVKAIERQSWKESDGSSITTKPAQERYYDIWLPRAAAAGELLAAILYLDGQPIAHQLCIADRHATLCLKTSYVDAMREQSPGMVVKWLFVQEVHRRGMRLFDLMGKCEPHKMRWATSTYSRTTFALFNRTLGGRLAQLKHRAASLVRNQSR